MGALRKIGLLVSVATAVAASSASRAADDLNNVPVDSLERVDTAAFQAAVAAAADAGELWVYDTLAVALRVVGSFEGRTQHISRTHDAAEAPRRAEVVVIEDGYLDDSVRGARYQITLESDKQGVWRPMLVQRAWRCWPGRGHESFAREPCR